MPKLLRVRATTKFHDHLPGDELLVREDKEIAALVKGGYFEILAIETTTEAAPAPPAKTVAEATEKPRAKPKRAAKGVGKAKAEKRV